MLRLWKWRPDWLGESYVHVLTRIFEDTPSRAASKPFWCAVCMQGFVNITELKGHASKHTPAQGIKRRRHTNSGHQRIRASQACNACAEAKVKCDDESVCRRCQKRKQVCVRGGSNSDASGSGSAQVAASTTATTTTSSPRLLPPASDEIDGSSSVLEDSRANDLVTLPSSSTTIPPRQEAHVNYQMTPGLELSFLESCPSTIPGMIPSILANNNINAINASWRNAPDVFLGKDCFEFDNDLELAVNSADLDFLDIWTSSFASPQLGSQEPEAGPENIIIQHEDGTTHDALRESVGRWNPTKKNYMADECDHLIVSPAATEQLDSPGVTDPLPGLRHQTLSTIIRDKIIIIIAEICKDGEVLREISQFPSAKQLSTLMWDFLAAQHAQIDSWIHLPSFRAGEASVELVLACVAAGSISRSDVAVRKFGFALQEVLTFQLRRVLEKSNVLTRHLQSSQAFAIDLQIGLWSGNKRKIERAMSFLPILLNLLRAAGRYRQASYHDIFPLATDSGPELDTKWKLWIQQESFKRLVFLMYVQATQGFFTNSMPPSISYSELSLPLPQARELWLATTPEEWKKTFLEMQSGEQVPRVSLVDCLREPSKTVTLHHFYDHTYSQLLTLYSISSLIQQYRQSHSVFSISETATARASSFVYELQRGQLLEFLQTCHYGYEDHEDPEDFRSLSQFVILNLLYIHLYVSVEQLELVAGREGLAEAQAAYPSVGFWSKTQDARQAICHAGKIFSVFPKLPRDSLQIFHAVALFHAALCIWMYGILSYQDKIPPDDLAKSAVEVEIESAENVNTQRWIRLGRGEPTIPTLSSDKDTTSVGRMPIFQSSAILSNTRQILREKFQNEAGSMPPVVEHISRALEILGHTGLISRVGA
ncbi:hypothetical protein BKA64DRAFT_395919 [Cadophora sp. MPI-SDFR-AT-0126]|nr:hypothetical protein BKA64DRAFT_395919 [Leotiomycetes sp. MPI-SDFR-AT-0126]